MEEKQAAAAAAAAQQQQHLRSHLDSASPSRMGNGRSRRHNSVEPYSMADRQSVERENNNGHSHAPTPERHLEGEMPGGGEKDEGKGEWCVDQRGLRSNLG